MWRVLPHAVGFTEGECDVRAGERLVARVKFAVVGGSAAAGGSVGWVWQVVADVLLSSLGGGW